MLHTLVPDLNIAPLKYAHILREHGGPMASITFRETSFLGRAGFEAFAYLDEAKTGLSQGDRVLYGNAHGTGSAPSKPEAIFRAISEALERWAWHSALQDKSLFQLLRYDLDPSTTGFAAYPGLGRQGARKRAFFEAAERWTLCEWWEGRLAHRPLKWPDMPVGIEGAQLVSPIPGAAVVVLWRQENDLQHYGFAAAHSPIAAAEKALVELQRNNDILAYFQKRATEGPLPELNRTERRLLFFAQPAGVAKFAERLSRQGSSSQTPKLLVDANVLGPWAEYAHVWRCLFDGQHFHEKDESDYFHF